MLNFAANISWLFQEWDFYDRFAAASDAGFVAVECLFPYEHDPDEIARHLARHKLTMALINLPPGDLAKGERGLAALPGRGDDFRAALNKGLRFAGATGARRLHAMAGIAGGPAAMEAYRDALALACDIAGPHGIDITIEPLNGQDVPGYLMNDFALARQVIAGLKRSNLKLQFDVYHRRVLQGDVIAGLEELMPIIGHIQIASAPGRHEPTSGECVNGEADDRQVLNAIDRLGYRGFVGCEYKPAGGTLAGLTWLREFAA